MKKLVPLAACAAVLLPLAVAQEQDAPTPPPSPPPGKLERVELEEEAPVPDATADRSHLDVGQVVGMLTNSDLDQRERDFDHVVRVARTDREVLRLLTDLSTSHSDPDLAWTARLALREVRRAGPLGSWMGWDPRIPGVPGLDDVRSFGLFEGLPDLRSLLPDPGRWSQSSVEIRQDEDGFVLRIRDQDGEDENVREYRGGTLEEILEANPELREEVDVRAEGIPGGMRFFMGPGASDDWFQQLLQEMRDGSRDPFRRMLEGPDALPLKEYLQPFRSTRPLNTRLLGVRVREVGEARAEALGIEKGVGLYVASVEPGSLAHLLGVGQGSVLLELNGVPLRTAQDITSTLAARGEQEPVHLLWIDGSGEKRTKLWRPR